MGLVLATLAVGAFVSTGFGEGAFTGAEFCFGFCFEICLETGFDEIFSGACFFGGCISFFAVSTYPAAADLTDFFAVFEGEPDFDTGGDALFGSR